MSKYRELRLNQPKLTIKPFHDATTSFLYLSKSIYKKLRTPRPPRVNIGGGG
jgi:hypothetical protein